MRRVLVFFGIVIVFSLAGRNATACTCKKPGTPCEGYGKAAAVFVGTVTGVRDSEQQKAKDVNERRKQEDSGEIDWSPMAYKFSVEQAYLGIAGSNNATIDASVVRDIPSDSAAPVIGQG